MYVVLTSTVPETTGVITMSVWLLPARVTSTGDIELVTVSVTCTGVSIIEIVPSSFSTSSISTYSLVTDSFLATSLYTTSLLESPMIAAMKVWSAESTVIALARSAGVVMTASPE